MGASWATLVSYSVAWMVVLLFFKSTRSIVWQGIRFAVPIVLVALLAVKAATFVSTAFVPSMFVGLAVFLAGALVMGFLKTSDMGYFSTAVRNALARRA
jgi:hypothetical protein